MQPFAPGVRAALVSALVLLATGSVGCDAADSTFAEQVVVSGSLVAGEPLGQIRLRRSSPLGAVVDLDAIVIDDAEVTVSLLSADGSVEAEILYEARGPVFAPVEDPPPVALPGRTYRLDVRVPESEVAGGAVLSAVTTVPEPVVVTQPAPASIPYLQGNGPELTIQTTSSEARQSVYLVATESLDPVRFEEVVVDGETRYRAALGEGFPPVPFILTFADCEVTAEAITCEEDIREFDEGQSPLINEESYILNGDGTALVQIPWLAFRYFGPTRVSLFAVDQAVEDFVATQAVQFGGSTLSPGEIPNITTNVDGGLGLFGAYARAEFELFVEPPEL